jgi:hypothetical protein
MPFLLNEFSRFIMIFRRKLNGIKMFFLSIRKIIPQNILKTDLKRVQVLFKNRIDSLNIPGFQIGLI